MSNKRTRTKRRYVMHIGRHKTGTSMLQACLASCEDQLLSQGVVYPTEGRGGGEAHHTLAGVLGAKIPLEWSSNLEDESHEFELMLSATEKSKHDIIVSSEAFQSIDPQATLRWFDADRMLVIVYLREQYEYLQSTYSQAIQSQGITLTFAEFVEQGWRPNYSWFLSRWKKLGCELSVGVYDRAQLEGGDIFTDFCARLDIDKPDTHISSRNPSIGGDLLAFKRELNRLPIDPNTLRLKLRSCLSVLAQRHPEYKTKPFVAPSTIEQIRSSVQTTNSEVALEFLGRSELFAPKRSESMSSIEKFVGLSPEEILLSPADLQLLFKRINELPGGSNCLNWLNQQARDLSCHSRKDIVGNWHSELEDFVKCFVDL